MHYHFIVTKILLMQNNNSGNVYGITFFKNVYTHKQNILK